MSIPHGSSLKAAKEFAQNHSYWLVKQKEQSIFIKPLMYLPLRGKLHLLCHDQIHKRGRSVSYQSKEINDETVHQLIVRGNIEHFQKYLQTYLRQEAREDIYQAVTHFCTLQGSPMPTITIRDQRTCWGSCSYKSGLSFSWRLIMAPRFVLDYVAAHEVAHIRVPNHSKQFWLQTEKLFPDFRNAKAWLKNHGHTLHHYCFSCSPVTLKDH